MKMDFEVKCPVCGCLSYKKHSKETVEDCIVVHRQCWGCNSTWDEVWAFVENRNIVTP